MSSNLVEIVAIGSELLTGLGVNSNASFISRKLSDLGFHVQRHTVLPDDADSLREGLAEALSCNVLVIATGGLGPTLDDLSKEVAAELFDSSLSFNDALANELRSRYGEITTLSNQATVPDKACLLKNRLGTAPGFIFSSKRGTLVLLPGVPNEMKEMFCSEVLPFLKKHFSHQENLFKEELYFGHFYESKIDPFLKELKEQYPEVQFGLYPRNGLITVQLKGFEPYSLSKIAAQIKTEYKEHLFDAKNGLIEEAVLEIFKEKGVSLSVAESCTGGALSARITSLSGASAFFLGGVISYSNQIKQEVLGIRQGLLQEKGAVSREVAIAMVEGVEKMTRSDFSVAVTGIAGPAGGTEEKPVGTVFIAIKEKEKIPQVYPLQCHGSRPMVIEHSANVALSELYFLVRSS
ncbi:CinA-like protein [Chlamydiales bacterium STE3]|nr:CinA-like protein [Chlamydiales bacterium STE3]